MRPAARVQLAIELLDQIILAARDNGPAADKIVADAFRMRRFAGSKDRRAVRELVYAAIRACGPVPQTGRAAMLALAQTDQSILQLFDGSQYGPAAIGPGEEAGAGGIAPLWLLKALEASDISGAQAQALLARAPLDVRVNSLKSSRADVILPEQGETLLAPKALRFPSGTRVEQWDAYKDGTLEVQDCGSQLAIMAVGARPGETVIDLCAGAGGKTVALAAEMENQGQLIASDTDRGRLSRLTPRAERAGAGSIQPVLLDPGKELDALAAWLGQADAVLVDAPCSGTGTFRRNPEARWRLNETQIERYCAVQSHLLDIAARLVRPGGRIIYVTCSLLDAEGPEQIASFLDRQPLWRADVPDLPLGCQRGHGVRLTPHHDQTDGFFIARLEKPC